MCTPTKTSDRFEGYTMSRPFRPTSSAFNYRTDAFKKRLVEKNLDITTNQ